MKQPVPETGKEKNRLVFLDNLRGIAILAVLCFHYFGYPQFQVGKEFLFDQEMSALFQFGFLGVQLFFIISGFVIIMTLHGCDTPSHFFVRRFARLWPAMVFASLFTVLVISITGNYSVRFLDFFPGIFFTEPVFFKNLFHGVEFNWLDGSYWTLAIEVKFYFWAALIYYSGKSGFSRNFLIFSVGGTLIYTTLLTLNLPVPASYFNILFISQYLGFFLKGIGFYYLYTGKKEKFSSLLIPAGFLIDFLHFFATGDAFSVVAPLIITLIFGAVLLISRKVSFKKNWLTLIGLSSYSLYLIHQKAGHAMILALSEGAENPVLVFLIILSVAAGFIFLAYGIFTFFEHPVNKWIVRKLIPVKQVP